MRSLEPLVSIRLGDSGNQHKCDAANPVMRNDFRIVYFAAKNKGAVALQLINELDQGGAERLTQMMSRGNNQHQPEDTK